MPRELYSYSRPVTEKPHAEVMLVNTQEHCTINTAEQRFKEAKLYYLFSYFDFHFKS